MRQSTQHTRLKRPGARGNALFRAVFLEPVVMLATVRQWLVRSIATGVLVGSGVSIFLLSLFALTGRSVGAPFLVAAHDVLPIGGLANGLLLYYGYRLNKTGLADGAFAAVHDQQERMPLKTLLIKPVAALVTLASGGSAGKEGPCSHIGASLGSGLGRLLRVNAELRKRLVACGVSAGFAGVFGTPIAGAIYGVEVLAIGRIRHDFLLPAIIGGVTAYQVSQFWGVPYPNYGLLFEQTLSQWLFVKTVVIGIICGLVARVYVDSFHVSRNLFRRLRDAFKLWPPLVPMLGGGVLAMLIIWIPTAYLGLWKSLLVAITLGSGFYGGVVTPQFVIGAITGNLIAQLFGISPELGAAVGLVVVVASASNTPIAAILMGVELFGGTSLLYVAGAAMSAYLIIGHRSIYPDQHMAFAKSSWIHIQPGLPVGQEKLHLSYGLLKWWSQRRRRR